MGLDPQPLHFPRCLPFTPRPSYSPPPRPNSTLHPTYPPRDIPPINAINLTHPTLLSSPTPYATSRRPTTTNPLTSDSNATPSSIPRTLLATGNTHIRIKAVAANPVGRVPCYDLAMEKRERGGSMHASVSGASVSAGRSLLSGGGESASLRLGGGSFMGGRKKRLKVIRFFKYASVSSASVSTSSASLSLGGGSQSQNQRQWRGYGEGAREHRKQTDILNYQQKED